MKILDQNTGFGVSDKYKVINTQDIVSQFEAEGYVIRDIQSAKVRNPEKNGFQKHLIRMSHPDTSFKVDGLQPEIVLKNAYDGTSSFNLRIGVFRFLCANGLEVGTAFQNETVRHVGQNVLEKVLEAAERIKMGFPEMQSQIEAMQATKLDTIDMLRFAESLKPVLTKGVSDLVGFEAMNLLGIRRMDDAKKDVFTVLNVIQENALKGAYHYETLRQNPNDSTKYVLKRSQGRKIKSLDRTSKVNQHVWDYALKLV